ncbi:MAG: hydantoinase/oxoprolinase family protein [Thermodesulfobacteriota bacterium]|nr:hydantoinase/oxoprolinase family protein [Thermodesulfobacteriota bacterium]
MFRVGVDTGGTFTDFILHKDNEIHIRKIPSTPKNPADAVLKGLNIWKNVAGERQIVHGSTVATNTLLERKGAKTALITTKGFEDILEIGRQNRLHLYNLFVEKRTPLVHKRYRFGVDERTAHTGEILRKADPPSFHQTLLEIQEKGIESIAVCLLFSYANPHNECIICEMLERTGIPISVSHRILPEYREYERCTTTVVNAYISPKMEQYITYLEENIESRDLNIMQSNGGFISAKRAKEEPIRTILSGPAAGVIGAFDTAKEVGYDKIITLDMGGTSTDVSLCSGQPGITTESSIDSIPIKVPMINIHTVGAGGGSIAHIDEGGSLKVGPKSAGADPGPACYGRGEALTVTDANLYLGRLLSDSFLGGEMSLDSERVEILMREFASRLGLSPQRAAEGIIEVVNATMERAIRVVSIEKGHDTREFILVSFGGGGGLHACELAESLSIPRVLIPKNPGLLSAFGMLVADVVKDYSKSVLIRTDSTDMEEIEEIFQPLLDKGIKEMSSENISMENLVVERHVDMRYIGQSFEISVPFQKDSINDFNALHRSMYGYSDTERPCEIVNVRVRMVGAESRPKQKPRKLQGRSPESAPIEKRMVIYEGEHIPFDVCLREKLYPGNRVQGPAIIVEYSSTLLLPPDFFCDVDMYENLLIQKV